MTSKSVRSAILGLGVLALVLALPGTASASDWKWSLTPYFWASQIGLDVSVNDKDFIDQKVSVSDLVDKLDFAFQVDLQGMRGRHGFLLDVSYFNLGGDERHRTLSGPVGNVLGARADLKQTMVDAGGIYNPSGDGLGFALIYGVRALSKKLTIDAWLDTPLQPKAKTAQYETKGTLWDGLVGVRYVAKAGDRWLVNVRGDYSTGGTEMTWSGLGAVGYTFGSSHQHAMLIGYRYMRIELKEKDRRAEIETRLGLMGPFFGVKIGF